MDTKILAHISAVAFVGVALSVAALHMQRVPATQTDTVTLILDERDNDPLSAEMRRCQAIGAAGAEDTRCLHAWAAQRSRFFMSKRVTQPQTQPLAPDDDMSPLGNDIDITLGSNNASADLPSTPAQNWNR